MSEEKENGKNIEKFISKNEDDTYKIGIELAKTLKEGDIVLLEGPLGAGKSVIVRGFLKGLGVDENIPSPTFTIVNEYSGKFKIYHFDFYRLNDPFELYEIGFEEYIYSKAISFIEWASKGGDLIPENAIKINIDIENKKRIITVER